MELFTARDFNVFAIPGFQDRMQALATTVRPKLNLIGEELAPVVAGLVDRELFAHVARHARRTVHPPDDTWVAIGSDKRGYKKDVHFKVAISGNCVRLLFEVGPEYYDKPEWAMEWKREGRWIQETVASVRQIAWFRDEHDEDPKANLRDLSIQELLDLGHELTRRRDGQLVLGRRIDRKQMLEMGPARFKRTVIGTFKPLAPLFSLHAPRRLAS